MYESTDASIATQNEIAPVTKIPDINTLISSLDDKLDHTDDVVAEDFFMEHTAVVSLESPLEIIEEKPAALEISEVIAEEPNPAIQETYFENENIQEGIVSMKESFLDIDFDSYMKLEDEIKKFNSSRKHKKIADFFLDKTKFLAHYAVVSTLVFVILLGAVNYSAYSTIAYNYLNPNNLKSSSREILSVIDNSKIKVFADEEGTQLGEEQQQKLQKKLAEDNAQLRDTYFSPKKLVPLRSNVDLSVDIVPYENRIIIPKIGKNVPLVDVDSRRGELNFGNLENIFMGELEKGVVRYPGTAKPGENGNAFVFGHSSNYPWMKGDYNDVFAMLDNLTNGDEIIVYYNQKKYTYVINEKKIIKPGNVKVLERDPNKKELSLMTCWPVGTSYNRLITFAELKDIK